MREVLRFLGALLLGLLLVGGTLGLGFLLLLQGEEGVARGLLRVAEAKLPLLLAVGFLFTLTLAALLHPLFLGYLAATRALGQEAEVLLSNPGHRLRLRGPFELQTLGELIHRLAAEKAALEQEVAAKVAEAKDLLEEERRRLEALVAHLPQGVVLAGAKGQVLLYNAPAKRLLGEGLGVGKSLLGLLDRGLLAHALALPEEPFLTQGARGPLEVRAVPLEGEGGFLLLLEEVRGPRGLDEATLHRLKDKVAGLQALTEALAEEVAPHLAPLAQAARSGAEGLAALVAGLEAASPAAEVPAEDLLPILAQALEPMGVFPGLTLAEEARGLLVQADTYALARGLAATLREAEEVFLQGERVGNLLHLTLRLPHLAPEPLSPLREAVEGARGSLWREGRTLHLLLPARADPTPRKPGPPPRSAPVNPRLLQGPTALEEVPLEALLYTALDLETTGLDPAKDAVIALGAVHVLGRQVLRQEVLEALVDPGRPIPWASREVHGLTWEALRGKPRLEEVLPGFRAFLEGTVLLAHNGAFDLAFLRRAGVEPPPLVDTLLLSHLLFPDLEDHRLEALAARFGVPVLGRHTALGDALMTAEVFVRMLPLLKGRGLHTLGQVLRACAKLPLARIRY